jgi:hypothetical protein
VRKSTFAAGGVVVFAENAVSYANQVRPSIPCHLTRRFPCICWCRDGALLQGVIPLTCGLPRRIGMRDDLGVLIVSSANRAAPPGSVNDGLLLLQSEFGDLFQVWIVAAATVVGLVSVLVCVRLCYPRLAELFR